MGNVFAFVSHTVNFSQSGLIIEKSEKYDRLILREYPLMSELDNQNEYGKPDLPYKLYIKS